MYRVAACLFTQHDLLLVCAAAAVCVLSWAGAVLVLDRVAAAPARFRRAWLFLAGLAAGGGTWATHFVAMLAYNPGVPVAFDLTWTLASFAIGVLGAWAAFELSQKFDGARARIAAGVVLGASLSALHFLGMLGIEAPAERVWAADLVVASALFCMAFAIAGVQANAARSFRGKALAAALFVLSAVFLHFTGVAALTLVPGAESPPVDALLNRQGLAVIVALGALLLLSAAAAFSLMDRRIARMKVRELMRMQRLADAALEGILFHDGRVILDANSQMAAMIGLEVEQIVGKTLMAFNKTQPKITPEMRASGDYRFETTLIGPRGETPVEVHSRLFNAAEGIYVSAVRDISERRRAEDAEAANIAKSQYLANMSHELRTPLNAIVGYAEMIMEEASEPDVVKDAATIRGSARHLLTLINDILDLSKTEAGKVELVVDDCDLKGLIEESCSTLAPSARERGNTLEVDVADDIGLIRLDGFRLKQCLLNLVSNAVKFTEGGKVCVSAHIMRGHWREELEIAVRDTGIGMTADQIGRVFQAFAQADESISRRYGGTGLGLAITERLVKLAGGSIHVESEPGEGSTFRIRLPYEPAKPRECALDRVA